MLAAREQYNKLTEARILMAQAEQMLALMEQQASAFEDDVEKAAQAHAAADQGRSMLEAVREQVAALEAQLQPLEVYAAEAGARPMTSEARSRAERLAATRGAGASTEMHYMYQNGALKSNGMAGRPSVSQQTVEFEILHDTEAEAHHVNGSGNSHGYSNGNGHSQSHGHGNGAGAHYTETRYSEFEVQDSHVLDVEPSVVEEYPTNGSSPRDMERDAAAHAG